MIPARSSSRIKARDLYSTKNHLYSFQIRSITYLTIICRRIYDLLSGSDNVGQYIATLYLAIILWQQVQI